MFMQIFHHFSKFIKCSNTQKHDLNKSKDFLTVLHVFDLYKADFKLKLSIHLKQ